MSVEQKSERVVVDNEEFLNLLAHELRNPLAPIMNAIHVIEKSSTAGNQLLKNSTEILGRQLNYVVGTINDLLDIAKIVKGEFQIENKEVEICSLIGKAIEEINPIFASRKHTFEVTLPPKDILVMGDAARLKHVIVHLLNNAAKFTETGGKISITANYNEETVNITVRDNGVGIPYEIMPEIFTLFSQPGNYAKHLTQGSGIGVGLTLALKVINMHRGTIECYSEGLNRGSEFSVILPLHSVTEQTRKPTAVTITPASQCLDIMVVDDHIDTAESLAVLLKMWGNLVRVCHSGTAAIQMAKTYHPDVALLDIGLPGYDGYQVAEKIKEECPDILLIAISGYGQKLDHRRSNNAGFQSHLVKPVVPEELKRHLQSKRA